MHRRPPPRVSGQLTPPMLRSGGFIFRTNGIFWPTVDTLPPGGKSAKSLFWGQFPGYLVPPGLF